MLYSLATDGALTQSPPFKDKLRELMASVFLQTLQYGHKANRYTGRHYNWIYLSKYYRTADLIFRLMGAAVYYEVVHIIVESCGKED
jgi:hypothetical protein